MNIKYLDRLSSQFFAAVIITLLAGCSSTETDMVQSITADTTPAAAPINQGPSPAELAEQNRREQMLGITLFYFDFDMSDLKPEALEPLRIHAQRLRATPSMQVRLEGHADERGTQEYNVALGERRAMAVSNFLQVEGVSARQIEVISYGEARPAVNGTNEQAWSRNRRVELKF